MTRALERQVTDKLIDARSAGAGEVRLLRDGTGITVQVTGMKNTVHERSALLSSGA
jgi:hypothetical protein